MVTNDLTLTMLTWRIWWANNASKWQMGFNSAFKELKQVPRGSQVIIWFHTNIYCINSSLFAGICPCVLCDCITMDEGTFLHGDINILEVQGSVLGTNIPLQDERERERESERECCRWWSSQWLTANYLKPTTGGQSRQSIAKRPPNVTKWTKCGKAIDKVRNYYRLGQDNICAKPVPTVCVMGEKI